MLQTLASLIATCAPQVHPSTMRALIGVESSGNPWAVSLNRPQQLEDSGIDAADLISRQPASKVEALGLTRRLLRQGLTTSVGLAQVNIEHAPRLHHTLSELLDPCTNLQIAQRILIDCDRAQLAGGSARLRLHRTLSCYNSGSYRPALSGRYVARIISTAHRLDRLALPAQRSLTKD
jgi:type IV secretion system protein VirB1